MRFLFLCHAEPEVIRTSNKEEKMSVKWGKQEQTSNFKDKPESIRTNRNPSQSFTVSKSPNSKLWWLQEELISAKTHLIQKSQRLKSCLVCGIIMGLASVPLQQGETANKQQPIWAATVPCTQHWPPVMKKNRTPASASLHPSTQNLFHGPHQHRTRLRGEFWETPFL